VAAAPAGAGSLVSATLTLEIVDLAPVVFVGTGVSGASAGSLSVTLAAGSGLAGMTHVPSPTSAAPPISGWNITMGTNAAGSFSGATPSVVGGAMPISLRVCAEAYGGLCLLNLFPPFGVNTTVTPPVVSGIGITMHGTEWTAGTVAVPLTIGGTATRMGSNGLNGQGVGTLVLVSAVDLHFFTNAAFQETAFAALALTFVPEPAALPLVGVVGVALALGVRRLR
jgi:hypothetical protein